MNEWYQVYILWYWQNCFIPWLWSSEMEKPKSLWCWLSDKWTRDSSSSVLQSMAWERLRSVKPWGSLWKSQVSQRMTRWPWTWEDPWLQYVLLRAAVFEAGLTEEPDLLWLCIRKPSDRHGNAVETVFRSLQNTEEGHSCTCRRNHDRDHELIMLNSSSLSPKHFHKLSNSQFNQADFLFSC